MEGERSELRPSVSPGRIAEFNLRMRLSSSADCIISHFADENDRFAYDLPECKTKVSPLTNKNHYKEYFYFDKPIWKALSCKSIAVMLR